MQLACVIIIIVISLSSFLLTPVNWQQFFCQSICTIPIQYNNPEVLSTNFESPHSTTACQSPIAPGPAIPINKKQQLWSQAAWIFTP